MWGGQQRALRTLGRLTWVPLWMLLKILIMMLMRASIFGQARVSLCTARTQLDHLEVGGGGMESEAAPSLGVR